MTKAGQAHKWEQGYQDRARTQNVLSVAERPVVIIHLTSPLPEESPQASRPWFLVHEPVREGVYCRDD